MRQLLMTTALLVPVLLGAAAATAQDEPTLKIGDKAPAIDIAHWVKGVEMDQRGNFEPITKFQKGHVYVLEFWATWCGPCRSSMPHLSEIQHEFAEKGVTVISVSDETLPKVIDFLFQTDKGDGKLNNDRTDYMLCTDPDESVKKDFFRAAGQTGIPCAFVIGKTGHVEWIGHPMAMDEPLALIVEGEWDRDAYAMKFQEAEKAKLKQREEAMALREVATALREAQEKKDWATVIKTLDKALADNPGNVSLGIQKFQVLLRDMNKPVKAYAYGKQLAFDNWDNPMICNALAWFVVDEAGVETRDLDFAFKLAKQGCNLTDNKDAAILDTLARVYYEMGDLKNAIGTQKKAVKAAGDNEMGAGIREVLKKYEAEAKKDG